MLCFRGREFQKRVAERLKEAEMDSKDRLKEKEEIEELKNRIFSGDHEDPSAEFEKVGFRFNVSYVIDTFSTTLPSNIFVIY